MATCASLLTDDHRIYYSEAANMGKSLEGKLSLTERIIMGSDVNDGSVNICSRHQILLLCDHNSCSATEKMGIHVA